ncbi:hypothetical protein HDU67_002457, partial [Dinochytrium kinnereticum]
MPPKKKGKGWSLFGKKQEESDEEDPFKKDAIKRSQRDVEEITNLYKDNVNKLIDRNTNLEILQETSTELKDSVKVQKAKARELSWAGFMKRNKWTLVITVGALIVLIIIIIVIVNSVQQLMETQYYTSTAYRIKRGKKKL